MKKFILIVILSFSQTAQTTEKGLLNQILITSEDEALNLEKTVSAEIMITKTEEKAIQKLKEIISKEKNISKNAENYFRLAELYGRRAKTYHFFEMNREEIKLKKINTDNIENIIGFKTSNERSKHLEAMNLYKKIISEFPKYEKLDSVIFNLALTYQRIGDLDSSLKSFEKIGLEYPRSEYLKESLLLGSEIEYSRQHFQKSLDKLNQIVLSETDPLFPYIIYKKSWNEYNLKNVAAALEHMKKLFLLGTTHSNKKYSLSNESFRDLSLFAYEALKPNEIQNYLESFLKEKDLVTTMTYVQQLNFDHSKYNQVIDLTEKFFKNVNTQEYLKALLLNAKSYEVLDDASKSILTTSEILKICSVDTNNEYCKSDLVEPTLALIAKWWGQRKNNKNHNPELNDLIIIALNAPEFTESRKELLQLLASSLKEQGKFSQGQEFFGNYSTSNLPDFKLEVEIQRHYLAFSELNFENQENKSNSSINNLTLIKIYEKFLALESMKKTDLYEAATDRLIELYFSSEHFNEASLLIKQKNQRTKTISLQIQKIQKKLDLYFSSKQDDLEIYKAVLNKSLHDQHSDEEFKYFTYELFKLSILQGDLQSTSKHALELSNTNKNPSEKIKFLRIKADVDLIGKNNDEALKTYIEVLNFKFDENIFERIFNLPTNNKVLRDQVESLAIKSKNKDYQLEQVLKKSNQYLSSHKNEEAFRLAKSVVSQASNTNIKAKARFIQAKILQQELEKQSLKSSNSKTTYLILLKNEKFEKAQKSLIESLSYSDDKNLKDEIIKTLISNLKHFSAELSQVMTALSNEEKNEISQLLSLLSNDLNNWTNQLQSQPTALANKNSDMQEFLIKFFTQNTFKDRTSELLKKRSTLPLGLLISSLQAESVGNNEKCLFLRKNLFDHLIDIKKIEATKTTNLTEIELNSILINYFENTFDMSNLNSELKSLLSKFIQASHAKNNEG